MPRSKGGITKVKQMTLRDETLMKQLANTGLCSMEQAKSFCNLNRDRLQRLEKSGYIKIDKCSANGGNVIEVARLNDKGRMYCESKLGQDYFYRTTLNQVKHDMKLTEAYYQVQRDFPGAVWKNETQIKNEHADALIGGGDCVDAVVVCGGGESFAVEVVGDKYTQQTIDNKVEVGNRVAGRTVLI